MTIEIGLYLFLALLSVLFRYELGLSQTCLLMGVEISDTGSKRGFQDALTPPISTKLTFLNWALIAATLAYLWWENGVGSAAIGVAIFAAVSIIVGATIIPKPESEHFKRIVYSSLANRHADYIKNNDKLRARATGQLLAKVEARYFSHFFK